MASLSDPYSGLAGLPSDFKIPQWQKGDKLSDSGEELGDSSSDAGSSFELGAAAGWDSSSDGSVSEDGNDDEERRGIESTPKASRTSFKGKERASSDATSTLSPLRMPLPSSSGSGSAKYTIRSRPRSNSRPTGIAPGPAAQSFSEFSQSSSLPSFPGPRSADLLSSRRPLGAGFQPRAKPARGLDRAISAPTNLFGGSPPVINKSKHGGGGLKGKQATSAPLSQDPDTEEEDLPSSPEHSVESIITRAWEMKQNSIDLSSRSLTSVPECIKQIAMFETRDIKTNIGSPTPMCLLLPSNCITTAGLHPALFKISNLYLLSLRQNQITELPQAISQLKNLKQLLLFNNKLRYLPAEILDLRLEELQLGANPLLKYTEVVEQKKKDEEAAAPPAKASAVPEVETQGKAVVEKATAQTRILAPRKQNFKVPSLVELCTRRLLEPVAVPKVKTFSPTSSGRLVRRHFDPVREALLCGRSMTVPPAHLLKPFLSLLGSIPHHLKWLLADLPESIDDMPSEIASCSSCKAPCVEFAEERLEWRSEIAGQKMCAENDKDGWVPILWRGCSANCLDFLDQ